MRAQPSPPYSKLATVGGGASSHDSIAIMHAGPGLLLPCQPCPIAGMVSVCILAPTVWPALGSRSHLLDDLGGGPPSGSDSADRNSLVPVAIAKYEALFGAC